MFCCGATTGCGIAERDGRYVTEIERLRNECERAQTVEVPLVNEVTEAEARRLSADAELETAQSTRNAVASELARWQARSEALQLALDSARARAGAEKLKDVSGVVGTLLDLVVIDEGWEASVKAALGEALLSVVVENTESARRALAHLRSASTSGAVLALGAKSEVVITGLVPAGALRIREHVRSTRKDVSDLLDLLLATSVQVKDWTAAVDAVMSDPRLVAVTPEGDRFTTTGWRIGVAGGGATGTHCGKCCPAEKPVEPDDPNQPGGAGSGRADGAAGRTARNAAATPHGSHGRYLGLRLCGPNRAHAV